MDDPAPKAATKTLGGWMAEAVRRLLASGFESAEAEVRAVAGSVLGLSPAEFWTRPERPLTAEETGILDGLVTSRIEGVPIQYLTRETGFRNLDLFVGPGVFVPRPETEGLVDHVLAFAAASDADPLLVLELGLGSGAILASILAECPRAEGTGVEASRLALDYARRNLARAGVLGRARLLEGDLFSPLPPARAFHVVVSNPPYIPESAWDSLPRDVRDFEPRLALLGGGDGLDVIRRIVAGAPARLAAGGLLALEIDASHGESVRGLLERVGVFEGIRILEDLAGRTRYCLARTRRRNLSIRDGGRLSER